MKSIAVCIIGITTLLLMALHSNAQFKRIAIVQSGSPMCSVGGDVYFYSTSGDLVCYNHATNTTQPLSVKTIANGEMYPVGDNIFFAGYDATGVTQLWAHNHKTKTTTQLTQFIEGHPNMEKIEEYVVVDGKFYFDVRVTVGYDSMQSKPITFDGIMVTDGTVKNTRYIRETGYPVKHLITGVGPSLLFENRYQELIFFDGTVDKKVASTNNSRPLWVIDANENRSYVFSATTTFDRVNIYKLDGKKCIFLTQLQDCKNMTLYKNEFYYYQWFNGYGYLFKCDTNFKNRQALEVVRGMRNPIANPSGVYFFALESKSNNSRLYKTDGTSTGTYMVQGKGGAPHDGEVVFRTFSEGEKDSFMYSACNKVYYSVVDKVNGYALWESNGTDTGTRLVMGNWQNPWSGGMQMSGSNGVLYLIRDDSLYSETNCPQPPKDTTNQNIKADKIETYPNPVEDYIYVNEHGNLIRGISLINTQGVPFPVELFLGRINVSSAPAGMYCLIILLEDGSIERRLINKR